MNAVITDATAAAARAGTPMLRISRPPFVTDLHRRPSSRSGRSWKTNSPPPGARRSSECRRSAGAEDVDEQEVDERQQQRVEHQPQLPEHRVEVLRAQLRARSSNGELAPPPQLVHVGAQRRQPDAVRLVDVALARELVFRSRGFGGAGAVTGQKRLVARSAEVGRSVSSATDVFTRRRRRAPHGRRRPSRYPRSASSGAAARAQHAAACAAAKLNT